MRNYVFISYSNREKADAEEIRELLGKNGIRSWMAPDDIPAGSNYAKEITGAIRDCSCFLLVFSEEAQKSQWVAKETERAVSYRKTILRIQKSDFELNDDFELYISTNQAIIALEYKEYNPSIKKLISTIKGLCGAQETPAENKMEHSPTGRFQEVKYESGNVYMGEIDEGVRNGYGIMNYKNGHKYCGYWKNNMFNGHGVYTFPDGEVYDGEWKDDKRNGHGINTWPDGERYVGEYRNGKRHGQGMYIYKTGYIFEGTWKDNDRNNHGVLYYADGRKYDGEWKDDKRTGHGFFYWQDGGIFEGEFIDNLREGPGIYQGADLHRYVGEYKKDTMDGYGVYTWPDDSKYEGQWSDGKRNGEGVYTDGKTGKRYKEIYENGTRQSRIEIDAED